VGRGCCRAAGGYAHGRRVSSRNARRSFPLLPGLFATAGVPPLQAGMRRVRVLHVLRGLLLTQDGLCPLSIKTALRKRTKTDMLRGSGSGCRRIRIR
jgi:hypothetical protein